MKILFAIAPFFFTEAATAQCISGNCSDGTGSANWMYGTYTGSFKNGEPHGEGVYTGLLENRFKRDSIRDEGFFQHGIFLSGTRITYKQWDKYYWDPCKERTGPCSFKKEDNYWLVPGVTLKTAATTYPVEGKQRLTLSGKTQEITYYRYRTPDGEQFSWSGKLKSGLPHGEGRLSGDSIVLEMLFDKGNPVRTAALVSAKMPRLQLALAFTDGMISNNYQLSTDSAAYTGKEPQSVFHFITSPQPTGFFDVLYKDGSRYSGQVVSGLPHGLGQQWFTSGGNYHGYFYNAFRHGEGVLTDAAGQRDSGLFYFNRFMKGTAFRSGKAPQSFPLCESGDCGNGFGKAHFRTVLSDTLYDTYEGYFANGLPTGFGTRAFRNGKFAHTYKGNFSGGLLLGQGEITANYGVVRKLAGEFKFDTLVAGAVHYFDGSRYEYSRAVNNNNLFVAMAPIVFGQVRSKKITGNGIYYLKSGSRVAGFFNAYGQLVRGEYSNSQGITMNLGNDYQSQLASLGANGNWDADNLDNVVVTIQQRKQFAEEEKKRKALAYAQNQERIKKEEAELNNPANWATNTRKARCGIFNGEGEFVYSNTFGRSERKYTTQYGTNVTVVYDKGRTYTDKVKCGACKGKGEVNSTSRYWVGKR